MNSLTRFLSGTPGQRPARAVPLLFLLTLLLIRSGTVRAAAAPTPEAPVYGPAQFDEHGNLIFRATPTLFLRSSEPQSIQYRVPLIRQNRLTFMGLPTARGCTAASVSMILGFWNSKDENNPILSAQEIIDRNALQGNFNEFSGLSIENVADELSVLGYELAILTNGDKESLLEALTEFGPIAVLCKQGWKPAGANHMSVVTGYNADTDRLTVHDPNIAQPLDIAWQTFDNIWGIDYSTAQDGSIRRAFFIIVPRESEE